MRRFEAVVTVGLFGLCAASVAAVLAPLGWPFELFAHFRWQLGAAAASLFVLAVPLARRGLLALAALGVGLQLVPLLSARTERTVEPRDCAGPVVRVATVNLLFRNRAPERVLQWLDEHPADVVVLQEVTAAWATALDRGATQYPHRRFWKREDPYGIGVLSRWPLADVEPVDLADDGLPSLVASVAAPGHPFRVIGLHTPWPVLKDLQVARDRALARAARLAVDAPVPTLIAGDLNLTPYAPAFGRLERESRLRDAYAGRAWRATWRAGFWPVALPIDHVLVPASACVEQADIGPGVGSDHRPLLVRLRWR